MMNKFFAILIAAALADGLTEIRLNALNDDIEATLDCLTALGALIDYDERKGRLIVRPIEGAPGLRRGLPELAGKASAHIDYAETIGLDCGESGSTLRFLLPVAAVLGIPTRFIGHGRLPERPNAALTGALRAHGASVDADTLPMNVRGPVSGGRWELPGNVSSQYVTGLLFALPLLDGDSTLAQILAGVRE